MKTERADTQIDKELQAMYEDLGEEAQIVKKEKIKKIKRHNKLQALRDVISDYPFQKLDVGQLYSEIDEIPKSPRPKQKRKHVKSFQNSKHVDSKNLDADYYPSMIEKQEELEKEKKKKEKVKT